MLMTCESWIVWAPIALGAAGGATVSSACRICSRGVDGKLRPVLAIYQTASTSSQPVTLTAAAGVVTRLSALIVSPEESHSISLPKGA